MLLTSVSDTPPPDDGSADHNIANELMRVIWSFGQVYPDYFHSPASGIESGTAQNDRFYQPDELKYHGSRNRGATSANFFGELQMHLKVFIFCTLYWNHKLTYCVHVCICS